MALFGNEKEQPLPKQQRGPVAPQQINMVSEGTVFEGTLHAGSDVRISGRVVGKVRVEGRAIIAQNGLVEGEVIAKNADVAGSVQGEMQVSERLILRTSARVEGNIQTAHLVVEEGAVFNGKCQMGAPTTARLPHGDGASPELRPLQAEQKEPKETSRPDEASKETSGPAGAKK